MLTEEQKEVVIANVNLAYKRANYWANSLSWELEECISIAYIGLCKAVMKYNGNTKLSTFSYRLIDNEFVNEVRRTNVKKRIGKIVSLDEPVSENKSTLYEFIENHDDLNMREIYIALEHQLTDQEKELLDLYYFQEKTQKEIAELYNLTHNTVSKYHRKLIEKIRVLVGG